jgi:Na+-transporting NADH:ubiquinone oxidoreductase subunit C
MKGGAVYTVVFMFVVSAVFTAILAVANTFYLPTIRQNEELAQKKSVLYVFGIQTGEQAAAIKDSYARQIDGETVGGIDVFARYDDSKNLQGYAIPFSGSGLWGTIKGYLAVSAGLDQILGVDFTSHSETPGLGGRIDELWYKEQFRGIALKQNEQITYRSGDSGQVDAITGASITSKSVLQILNQVLEKQLPKLEVEK